VQIHTDVVVGQDRDVTVDLHLRVLHVPEDRPIARAGQRLGKSGIQRFARTAFCSATLLPWASAAH
jgi:hypothetical protein